MKNKYKISLDVCCCGDMPDGVPHVYCNTLAEAQKLMVDLFELGSWDGIPVNYDEKAVVVFAPDDSPVVGLCGNKYCENGIYRYYCWSVNKIGEADLKHRYYLCTWSINDENDESDYRGRGYYLFGDEAAASKWGWRKADSLEEERKLVDKKYGGHHTIIVAIRWSDKFIEIIKQDGNTENMGDLFEIQTGNNHLCSVIHDLEMGRRWAKTRNQSISCGLD